MHGKLERSFGQEGDVEHIYLVSWGPWLEFSPKGVKLWHYRKITLVLLYYRPDLVKSRNSHGGGTTER